MANKFLLYADDLEENLSGMCRPTVFPGSFSAGGGYTPYFAVNAPPGFNIAGLFLESTATLIASATCASTAGTDILGLILAGYNVSDAPNADARCRTVTCAGAEEAERLLMAPGNTGSGNFLTYPRTGASTTATGTQTYTAQMVIPCGEPTDAVQVQFKLPASNTVFTSGVTSISIAFTVYVIPGVQPSTIAFVESPLPTYGASAVVPLEQYQPTNIAPDIIDFVGASANTSATGVFAQVAAYDTSGAEIVNMLTQTAMYAAQFAWPGAAVNTKSTIINTKGARLSRCAVTVGTASQTFDTLWIQVTDVPSAGPSEGHDATPSPPATQKVGTSTAGTVASSPAKGGGKGGSVWGRRSG
jgi:hypothetical protein